MIRLKKFDDVEKSDICESIWQIYYLFLNTNVDYIVILNKNKYEGIIYKSFFIKTYSVQQFHIDDTILSSGIDISHIASFFRENQIETQKESIYLLRENKELSVIPILDKNLKVICLYEKSFQDVQKHQLDFFRKYNYILLNGYSIHRFCKEQNFKKINIIGAGDMAVVLYNDILKGGEIKINCILDHNNKLIGNMQTSAWTEAKKVFTEADASIITYLSTSPILKYEAVEVHGGKNVLDLNDIVNKIYDRVAVYEILKVLFLKMRNQGIAAYYVKYPRVSDIIHKTTQEDLLANQAVDLKKKTEDYKDQLIESFRGEYSYEEINREFLRASLSQRKYHGYTIHNDFKGKYINIIGGKRVTIGMSESFGGGKKKVYVFGNSGAFSMYCEDKYTLCSQIQQYCDKEHKQYSVINNGVIGIPINQIILMITEYMQLMEKGDKVVLIYNINNDKTETAMKEIGIPIIDGRDFIQRPHEYGELFVDKIHMNRKGEELLANKICDTIFSDNILPYPSDKSICEVDEKFVREPIMIGTNEYDFEIELTSYLRRLPEVDQQGIAGSIVMNCNPFTNGHKHLICTAAKLVDILYVFVVQENKSVFPFEDRFMLVKKGCQDFSNVIVVPSGKFMISSVTFPEYFEKESNKDVVIDVSNDLRLFCTKIAPHLRISVRFAGTEPNDIVTRQYNQAMKQILPEYGIEFIEIPRVEQSGEPVSASLVRKYLKEKNWVEILKLVPESTYEYLYQKYNQEDRKNDKG